MSAPPVAKKRPLSRVSSAFRGNPIRLMFGGSPLLPATFRGNSIRHAVRPATFWSNLVRLPCRRLRRTLVALTFAADLNGGTVGSFVVIKGLSARQTSIRTPGITS